MTVRARNNCSTTTHNTPRKSLKWQRHLHLRNRASHTQPSLARFRALHFFRASSHRELFSRFPLPTTRPTLLPLSSAKAAASPAASAKKSVKKSGAAKLSAAAIKSASEAKSSAKKGKGEEVPPVIVSLLEEHPFSSVILVEAEGSDDKPLLIITPDFCTKGCGWSALDDGDVNLPLAEAAVKAHVASGCKKVAPKDFKDLEKDAKKAEKSASKVAAAPAKAAAAPKVKAAKAPKATKAAKAPKAKKAAKKAAPKAKAAKKVAPKAEKAAKKVREPRT